MIVVVASFKAQPDQIDKLGELLKNVVPLVQQESGCINYVLHRAVGDPGTFMFYEAYQDKEALEFHSTTPYFKELISAAMPYLAEPPEIKMYKELASISK